MKRLLPFLFCLPLLCYGAQDSQVKEDSSLRVSLGSRKTTSRTKKRSKKRTILQEKCFGYKSNVYTPTYSVKSVGADGETLVTTDETVWQIAPSSTSITSSWSQNAPIVISPSKWYSKYDYYLTNTITQETVNAKLSQGPFLRYALYITRIIPQNNMVTLSDGSTWQVYSSGPLASWLIGEAVLLGVNSGWFGSSHIIININENSYLEATFIQ